MAEASTLITARGVRKEFARKGRITAIERIDLDVRDGEFLCLIGPSGCGKSTFLYMVAGLVGASGGTLDFAGQPIRGPGRERGLVFQEDALFPWLSVFDNVAYGLRLSSAGRTSADAIAATVHELIGLVGLQGFEGHMPNELSGGMKQRAAIAACLATRPRVLLMDEPFGALDAQTRAILQKELLRIHETLQRTTLFVTHDIREAVLLSDRVAVMSARPGVIKAIVSIDLPRPRWQQLHEQDPAFLRLERQLHDLLDSTLTASPAPA